MARSFLFRTGPSLRVRIGVAFGCFSFALALVLSMSVGELGRRNVEYEARRYLVELARQVAQQLDAGLYERLRDVQIAAERPLFRLRDSTPERMRNALDVPAREKSEFLWVGVVDRDGTVAYATGGLLEGESLLGLPIFENGIQAPFIGSVHDADLLASHQPLGTEPPQVLDVAAPIYDEEGTLTGAICGWVKWEWVRSLTEEILRPIRARRGLEVLVLDREGIVQLGPNTWESEGLRITPEEITSQTENDAENFVYGVEKTVGFRDFAGLGWTVLVRQSTTEALAAVHRLQQLVIYCGIGGGVLAGLLGWALAGALTRPISEIAQAARRLANGDVLATKHLMHTETTELCDLSSALRLLLETRERQAHELRQSFRQFTSIFENAAVGISQVSLDMRWLRVNHRLSEITGYTPEELRTKTFKELTHPEDVSPDLEKCERLLQGEAQSFSMEKRYIRKDGKWIWVTLTVSVVKDDLGKPDYFISVIEDITARKQAEAALRESESRFREMADCTPVMIWTCDTDRQCTWVNRPWIDFTGRTIAQELGHGWAASVHPDDATATWAVFERAFLERGEFRIEYRLRRWDGEYRWMLTQGVPLFRGETFAGFIGSAIDITESRQIAEDQRNARENAEAASRAKDEFLAALSHELRTPLNPVLLIASEHEQSADLPPQVRADFAAIRKNIALEARLIDDLLDLTRISRGKLQLQMEAIDIHAVLHQALNLVRSELEAKQLVITLDLSSPEHRIFGDSARLQQVFWNIVLNAVKFTPAGGTIAVRTRLGAERSIRVEIIDSGLGIEPEEMPRIFETFGQGKHAHTPHRFGGLGLGLAIARLLVERHEGRIWAESEGRGLGATFHVELPLADAEVRTDFAPAPAAPAQVTRRRILLVEDHEATRSTLLRLLTRHGHEVQGAETLATARALAATGEFELVISDLGLPDGNGHELMMELRTDHGLLGIALSGYGMEEDIQRSHECGFYAHLTKPVDISALESAIAQMPPTVERPSAKDREE